MAKPKWYFIDDEGSVQTTYDMNSLKHVAYRLDRHNENNWRRKDIDRISSVWVEVSEVPQLILMAHLIGA